MTYPIAHAVASAYVPTFKEIGIRTTEKLLDRAAQVGHRKALTKLLAFRMTIPEADILDSVNAADLLRVKGLGPQYIALLRSAGVITVRELRYRNPEKLYGALSGINEAQKMVDVMPALKLVAAWIEQAKRLPLKVTYR